MMAHTIYIDRQGGSYVAFCYCEGQRMTLATGFSLADVERRAAVASGYTHIRFVES